jgi:cell division protein YceG involved in septum cleavage
VSSETESTAADSTETVSIQVRSGASSYTVSKDLAAAGLVEDAAAYDAYLCNNGYSKRIRVGTYAIAPGTSEEDIAKIITQKN